MNTDKTEALLVRSRRRVGVSQDNHLRRVGDYDSSFKDHVKNLGIYIAATLYVVKHTDHFDRSAHL